MEGFYMFVNWYSPYEKIVCISVLWEGYSVLAVCIILCGRVCLNIAHSYHHPEASTADGSL